MAETDKKRINITVIILIVVGIVLGVWGTKSTQSNKQYREELKVQREIFNTETSALTGLINQKEDTIRYLRDVISAKDKETAAQKKVVSSLRLALDTISVRDFITEGECYEFVVADIPTEDSLIHLISADQACAIADSLYELSYIRIIMDEQVRYEDMLLAGINERDNLVLQVGEQLDLTSQQLKASETFRGELDKQNKRLMRKLRTRSWLFGGATVGLVVLAIAT